MKKIILGILIVIASAMGDTGKILNLFTNVSDYNKNMINSDEEIKDLEYGKYNTDIKNQLEVGIKIKINLPGKSSIVTIKNLDKKSKDNYTYTAISDDATTTIVNISEYKNEVIGTINTRNKLYNFTLKHGNVIINSVNIGTLHDDLEGYTEEVDTDTSKLNNKMIEYTVIVAYTKGFADLLSNTGKILNLFTNVSDYNKNMINSDGEIKDLEYGKYNIIINSVNIGTLHDHPEGYTEEVDADFLDEIDNTDTSKLNNKMIEYTVIVAYTKGFADLLSNNSNKIQAYMNLLESETNTAYANSKVKLKVKIVYHYQTAYIEPYGL